MNLKSVRTGAWITVSGAFVVALLSGVAYTQGPATLVQIMTGGAIVSTSNRLPVDATGTGGGAVTIADGADVTQGTTTDAVCATDNGTCTVEAVLKRIAQRITSLITALGSPFQVGGSIGNTSFGAVVNSQTRAARNFPGCSVTTSSAQCLVTNTAVQFLQVQNTGAGNAIACAFGATAILNNLGSFQLASGQSASWGPNTGGVPTGALNCIAATGTTPLYLEWN